MEREVHYNILVLKLRRYLQILELLTEEMVEFKLMKGMWSKQMFTLLLLQCLKYWYQVPHLQLQKEMIVMLLRAGRIEE